MTLLEIDEAESFDSGIFPEEKSEKISVYKRNDDYNTNELEIELAINKKPRPSSAYKNREVSAKHSPQRLLKIHVETLDCEISNDSNKARTP